MSAEQSGENALPRNQRPAPEVGTRWRARRKGEEKRTVEVVDYDGRSFVWTRTLTTTYGDAPRKATISRLRVGEFHYAFDPLAGQGEVPDGR